jgi:FixJ family two-component response regulator
LRAIVLTGMWDRARSAAALQAGACDVVKKPITTELLDAVIRRALVQS